MTIEQRLEKLESIIINDDGSTIDDGLMALYGNMVQFQILMGDFFHDLAVTSGKLMEEIAKYIPDEIVEQLRESQEDLAEVIPINPDGETE